VGNTPSTSRRTGPGPVHPHSRGEHGRTTLSFTLTLGSPPLAWGTHAHGGRQAGRPRFTPTRVGNTSWSSAWTAGTSVHPHSRGEHTSMRNAISSPSGSPPLAWGTPNAVVEFPHRHRFTPTRVGNTCSCSTWWSTPTVHPHSRGEHALRRPSSIGASGSPPLAWGTLGAVLAPVVLARFTPTRVGNTSDGRRASCCTPVHPHSRGEHPTRGPRTARTTGSPPLAWGTRRHPVLQAEVVRFTPTRVGNTYTSTGGTPRATVHPHSRGEHAALMDPMFRMFGSPPLAWGTRDLVDVVRDAARFTPTRVGNTS